MIMGFYGVKLKFKEWFGLQMITHWGNQLIPFKGGLSARAIYFKKKYRFPYISSAGVIGIAYLIDFFIYGSLGLILSFFLPVTSNIKYSVFILFGVLLIGSIFILFFLPSSLILSLSVGGEHEGHGQRDGDGGNVHDEVRHDQDEG